MAIRSSTNYDKIKVSELIKDYFLYESDFAEVELKNRVLEGEEIIDAFNDILSEYNEEKEVLEEKILRYSNRIKKYHKIIRELKLPENQRLLIKNLELLVKGREGSFIDKINKLLKEVKKED